MKKGRCRLESKYQKGQVEKLNTFFKSLDWNNINKKPDFTFVYHAKVLENAILTDFVPFSPFLLAVRLSSIIK